MAATRPWFQPGLRMRWLLPRSWRKTASFSSPMPTGSTPMPWSCRVRDRFKASGRMLAVLTAPGATLPNELAQDVLLLDEPLPSAEDLKGIVRSVFSDAKMDDPDAVVVEKAVDALIGLAAFPAEQSLAMSLGRKGLDTDALWERKRQVIEQTPGLSVWRGGGRIAGTRGVGNSWR